MAWTRSTAWASPPPSRSGPTAVPPPWARPSDSSAAPPASRSPCRASGKPNDLPELHVGALAGARPGVAEVPPVASGAHSLAQLSAELVESLRADRRAHVVRHRQ